MGTTGTPRPRWLDVVLGLVILALVLAVVMAMRYWGGERGVTAEEAPAPPATGSSTPTAPSQSAPAPVSPSASEPGSPAPSPTTGSTTSPSGSPTTSPKSGKNGVDRPGPPQSPQQLASQAASDLAKAAEDAVPGEAAFRIGNFNVLGASHTRTTGKAPGRPSGAIRMRSAVRLLESHRVDVVGFQEFEPEQSEAFDRITGATWDSFPGTSGAADVRRTIAWRTDVWEMVRTTTVAMPYFNGNTVHSPVVLLRHRDSGREVWFANFHQAANTRRFHSQEQNRDQGTARQVALVRRLHQGGTPVVITGDMNEREEYWCTMSAALPLVSADGSSRDVAGCHTPGRTWIDWIVGTQEVGFSGYVRDRGALARAASDHPLVSVTALVSP
ncbi:endonuclease/exonuclease/phosphatase family protein [Nocardioides insulae]|uniref:endonuclease/exonuclease/phosphatase family protein n=1 Tax=Nocardioides insulae TaxID=394734 RepID=UPI0004044AE3|nr:endonuclease/exonuclease/phosphatase family protein [Nocardioides insulae]